MKVLICRLLLLLLLCLLSTLTDVAVGYPVGALDTPQVCRDMIPGHDTQAQANDEANPYQVSPSTTVLYINESMTVSLGGWSFKGFLLEARLVGGEKPVGSWGPQSDAQTICGGTALTHTTPYDGVLEIKPVWSPPPDLVNGTIVHFLATVVQHKIRFWVKIESPEVIIMDSPLPTEEPITMESPLSTEGPMGDDPSPGKTTTKQPPVSPSSGTCLTALSGSTYNIYYIASLAFLCMSVIIHQP